MTLFQMVLASLIDQNNHQNIAGYISHYHYINTKIMLERQSKLSNLTKKN